MHITTKYKISLKTTYKCLFTPLLLAYILCAFCHNSFASSYDTVVIDNNPESIGRYLEYYEDVDGTKTFEDILAFPSNPKKQMGPWIKSESDAITAGFTQSVYWVKFTVDNSNNMAQWKLEASYPLLDSIELYYPDSDNEYIKLVSGDTLTFSSRPVLYRNFVFPIQPSQKVSVFYMRFKTTSSMQILLKKWPNYSFSEAIDKEKMLYGILFGIILFSFISNFSGWYFLRDTAYLWAAFAMLSSGGYLASVNGLFFQYISPNSTWIQSVCVPFFMSTTFLFGILFGKGFLDTKNRHPKMDKILVVLLIICSMFVLSTLTLPYGIVIRAGTFLVLIYASTLLTFGFISLSKGNKFARYYIAGWGTALIGTGTFSLKSLGFIPSTPFTIWSQEFGFGSMGIFIAMAFSDRFFQMQKAQETERLISLSALENAEQKYRSLFENAIEGIFQMDLDGHIISANNSFSMIVGTPDTNDDLNTTHFPYSLCCLDKKNSEQLRDQLTQLLSVTDYESKFSIDGDEIRWISISIKSILSNSNNPLHYEGSITDITESKKREQAEKDMRMAEASTEAKSLFLANMSHEIRTPMNAILGFTGLAIDLNKDEHINNYLRKTRAASSNLLGIINDILDFSKIEAGKLEIEQSPFSVKEVLDNLNSIVSDMADDKKLKLTIETDPDIPDALVGDPLRIGQILLNLTNNAIKFTHKGSIDVRLDLLMLDKQDLSISLRGSVKDTGIGIENETIKRLFNAFSQADSSTTRQFGGTGLGLSISKQLIELMGGELFISSDVDKGSTFFFDIHCQLQDNNKKHYPSNPAALKGLRALVVDDQADSQELIKIALQTLKIDSISVSSSEEALHELTLKEDQGHPYDFMLVDWLMPETDGIACCQLVKKQSKLTTPHMILVTGYSQENIRTAARDAGIEGYLLKPLQATELSNTLLRILPTIVPNSHKTKSLKGVHVLIVEDVPMNQELATVILTDAGMTVDIANNGLEAVNSVQKNTYDVVLMDMQMPIMGGEEATQKIRMFNNTIPIIAMTANAMVTDKEKCIASGMNDYVAKPIDPDLLFTAIRSWVPDLPETDEDTNTENKNNPSNIPLPDQLPGIDVQQGIIRTQYNITLYLKMLSDFQRSYASSTKLIVNACSENDRETVERLAHTIKGLAANLSANPLAEIAAEIEALAESSVTDVPPLLDKFDAQLSILLDSIDILNQHEHNTPEASLSETKIAPETLSNTNLIELVSDIEKLIENQKLEALDKAVELSKAWPFASSTKSVESLIDALDQFDFPAASAHLDRLTEDLPEATDTIQMTNK